MSKTPFKKKKLKINSTDCAKKKRALVLSFFFFTAFYFFYDQGPIYMPWDPGHKHQIGAVHLAK